MCKCVCVFVYLCLQLTRDTLLFNYSKVLIVNDKRQNRKLIKGQRRKER